MCFPVPAPKETIIHVQNLRTFSIVWGYHCVRAGLRLHLH